MSLIQQALEKGDDDRNKRHNRGSTIAKAQQKVAREQKETITKNQVVSPKTSPAKTKELKDAARKLEKFDPKISPQAPESLIRKSVTAAPTTTYKRRPYNKTRYFIVGLILLIMTVALAACYFLALEMTSAWSGTKPETIAERVTTVQKIESSVTQSEAIQKTLPPPIQEVKVSRASTPEKTVASTPKKLPYKLSGITSTGGIKYALINNKILQAGDEIDSFSKVQTIENKQVTIIFQGNEVLLEM